MLSNHIDDTNDFIDHCYHIVLFVIIIIIFILSLYVDINVAWGD